MKSTRKSIMMVAVILAVVFAVSSVVMARGYGRSGGGYCSGQGFGGPGSEPCIGPGSGGRGFGGGPDLGAIMSLDLSDSQRDQALKVMETYQIDRIKTRGEVIKDSDNLRTALQADKVNEQDVRKAYKKLSLIKEDMLIARAKMVTEMKAILTPEQAKLLDKRTEERSDGLESQRNCGRPFAGGWSGDCPRR